MIEQELWNEEESDKRMNVIAQNGNDGLHYSEEDSDPYAEALNSVNECIVKLAERTQIIEEFVSEAQTCLLYTSPSPRDGIGSRMPSSA